VKFFTLDQKCIINVASSILGVKWGVGGSLIKSRLISRDESECFYPHVKFIARGLIEGQ
jgi:hypothetical protein